MAYSSVTESCRSQIARTHTHYRCTIRSEVTPRASRTYNRHQALYGRMPTHSSSIVHQNQSIFPTNRSLTAMRINFYVYIECTAHTAPSWILHYIRDSRQIRVALIVTILCCCCCHRGLFLLLWLSLLAAKAHTTRVVNTNFPFASRYFGWIYWKRNYDISN